MGAKEKMPLSREEIREKIIRYCAYQERSHLQVSRKLRLLGLREEDFPDMLEYLSAENYLNEKRFVAQYVRSRSASKGWGPAKIAQALHRETGGTYRESIQEDAESAERALKKLEKDLKKKQEELQKKGDPRIREKLIRFCLSRGFDTETALKLVSRPL
jgi:regulatory protein